MQKTPKTLHFNIITIFPNFFDSIFNHGVLKRALKNQLIDISITNVRDFSKNKYKQIDDTPFGGGPGMVLMPEPLFKAIEQKKTVHSYVTYLSPQGKPLTQAKAKKLASKKEIILICGRYEGIDQRVIDQYVDEEISIGDYILSGGEIAAAVLIEAVSRFIPGVLGNEESKTNETFSQSIGLGFPQYTKPREIDGMEVPAVLLSGNHKKIEEWRQKKALEKTRKVRPDLLKKL